MSQYAGSDDRLGVVVLDICSPATWQNDSLKDSSDLVILSSSMLSEWDLQEVF